MATQSLQQRVAAETSAAGLAIEGSSSTLDSDDFGDGHITGRLGPMAARFVRERGQDWLEVGPVGQVPPLYYSFQDVQIALGWKSVSEVLDMRDVEPLGDVLKRIASHWSDITVLLSGDPLGVGWRKVAEAANARGDAFVARLR